MKHKVNPPVGITENCTGCQQCAVICPSFVLDMIEAKAAVVRGEWCIGCGQCGAVCPTEAIFHEGSCFDLHPKKGEAPATSSGTLELL
jgi:Pyruvate/2-oxoacid:ferredoxin oxidoreductase delta subunit